MKAIIRTKAGKDFTTMKVQNHNSPSVQAHEVKVRMVSSRINPVDMDLMKGFPSLKYKKPQIGGVDGAGEIIEVGAEVKNFAKGDQVFFYRLFTDIGTWAEEITIPAQDVAHIPANLSLEEAGSIALPLLTAYESIISLKPNDGERILIHGAGGGVGYQAVNLAKAIGLKVIANGSPRDEAKLKAAEVDEFINYKQTSFFEKLKNQKPDYIMDVLGKNTLIQSIKLNPKKVISVAYPDTNQMHKTGVQLPGFLVFIMNMMNAKFRKLAKRNHVELIGQVTGANGKNLDTAARIIEAIDTYSIHQNTKAFSEIEKQGMTKKDLGKTILFQQ